MIKIDKSRFSAAELEQYEALVAKGAVEVDPNAAQEHMDTDLPEGGAEGTPAAEGEGMNKSAVSPEITAALQRMEALAKSVEMREFMEIAKKYAPLGENETELAQRLYDMKKSDEKVYNSYVAILDKSLGLVEKSGIFAEIGKSAGAQNTAAGAEDKIAKKAEEIMKSNPTMDYDTAVAKAWEENPALFDEYDSEYLGR